MSQVSSMDIWKVECTIVLSKACTIFGKTFGSLSLASVTKTFFNIKTSQTWKPDQKIMFLAAHLFQTARNFLCVITILIIVKRVFESEML